MATDFRALECRSRDLPETLTKGRLYDLVMAGLDPAIHGFLADISKNVDARHKAGHD